jgi:hypothetical protein
MDGERVIMLYKIVSMAVDLYQNRNEINIILQYLSGKNYRHSEKLEKLSEGLCKVNGGEMPQWERCPTSLFTQMF